MIPTIFKKYMRQEVKFGGGNFNSFLLQTKKIFSNRQEAKFGGGNPNTFYNFYRGMRSNLAEEIRIAFEKFLIGETQRQEAKFGGGTIF